jgi:hypothetical protein
LDQDFVRQSEAEEMNTPSLADTLVVQALGRGRGGVQCRIRRGAREIVFSDSETVGRKKRTRPPGRGSGLPQKPDSHPEHSEAERQFEHVGAVFKNTQSIVAHEFLERRIILI